MLRAVRPQFRERVQINCLRDQDPDHKQPHHDAAHHNQGATRTAFHRPEEVPPARRFAGIPAAGQFVKAGCGQRPDEGKSACERKDEDKEIAVESQRRGQKADGGIDERQKQQIPAQLAKIRPSPGKRPAHIIRANIANGTRCRLICGLIWKGTTARHVAACIEHKLSRFAPAP